MTSLTISQLARRSGVIYSIASAPSDGWGSMPMSESIMLVVGVAVLVHGSC
jgi:hypothetical protein